jgi:hypothetical protein
MTGRAIVLVVCGDAGGAEAVAPVAQALGQDASIEVRALLYGQAPAVWDRYGMTYERLNMNQTAADVMAGPSRPSLLLCGTSFNDVMAELKFVAAAKSMVVPSLGVFDSWTNYSQRFQTGGHVAVTPDRLAVMDERARAALVSVGFDAGSLVVTGQPALDRLTAVRSGFTATRRSAVRKLWNTDESSAVVLFASQPFTAMYSADDARLGAPFGFDEYEVLALLIDALDEIAAVGRDVTLVVRPHPREGRARLDRLSARNARIIVSDQPSAHDAVLSADLVVGMNSILLLEAAQLGAIVLSLQPGLTREDILPSNDTGATIAVYDAEAVKPAVSRWLTDEAARAAHLSKMTPEVFAGATQRVADLAREIILRRS